nr:uncharacterized protein LOC127329681 [Lolium perenne]
MFDSWDEAALEAAVEVVEADAQLAEYEAWEEAALAATVDAYVADERQGQEAERRERKEARREAKRQGQEAERLEREEAEWLELQEAQRRREALSQRRWEAHQQQGWEELAMRRLQREETRRQDEVSNGGVWRMQLRLQMQELDHRRRWEELEQQLRQEAVAADRATDDEEENPPIDVAARTSTLRTLVVSDAQPDVEETSPPQQNVDHPTPPASPHAPSPKRARVEPVPESALQSGGSATPLLDNPLMQEFIRLGTQFVGYHDCAKQAEENLAEANKRADTLAHKLEQSEKARKKAEADAKEAKAEAATVEDLRKKLHEAETSLSEHTSAQSAREEAIIKRLASQSRRFARKTGQEYELRDPENDPLLDALSLLEIHGDEARDGLAEAEAGLSQLYPYFFPKKEQPAPFLALAKLIMSFLSAHWFGVTYYAGSD